MQALLSIQSQQTLLSQQRHLKSEQATEKGFAALAQAEAESYRDKRLLREACDFFAEGISQNRLNPDPHLGMAIVLFLLKDYPLVRSYLQEVRRLTPDHPDLPQLEQAMADTDPAEGVALAVEDLLNYEELETRIHVYFRDTAAKQQDPSALILAPSEWQELQALYQYQSSNLEQFQLALKELDAEHDTSALHKMMIPLQQLFKRTEKQLKSSELALQIQAHLSEIQSQLQDLVQKIALTEDLHHLHIYEHQLEQTVDLCDRCADRLDELSQAGYRIDALESHYEKQVALVEHCFELIDGKH